MTLHLTESVSLLSQLTAYLKRAIKVKNIPHLPFQDSQCTNVAGCYFCVFFNCPEEPFKPIPFQLLWRSWSIINNIFRDLGVWLILLYTVAHPCSREGIRFYKQKTVSKLKYGETDTKSSFWDVFSAVWARHVQFSLACKLHGMLVNAYVANTR